MYNITDEVKKSVLSHVAGFCNKENEEKAAQYMDIFVSFAEKGRREGILALEDCINGDEPCVLGGEVIPLPETEVFKEVLQMIIDGNDVSSYECVADNYILTASTDIERYLLLILKQGAISIGIGEKARIMSQEFCRLSQLAKKTFGRALSGA